MVSSESTAQPIRSYKDLDVWKTAISLAEAVYASSSTFPRDERFGMTAQMRRSAVSIAANIAEGNGRESTPSFIQFLRIAQGSLKELETHLVIAERVKLLASAAVTLSKRYATSIGKMLRNLIRSLERKLADRT